MFKIKYSQPKKGFAVKQHHCSDCLIEIFSDFKTHQFQTDLLHCQGVTVAIKPHFYSPCERGCSAPTGHLDALWGHPQKGHWAAVRLVIHLDCYRTVSKTLTSLLSSQATEMVQLLVLLHSTIRRVNLHWSLIIK